MSPFKKGVLTGVGGSIAAMALLVSIAPDREEAPATPATIKPREAVAAARANPQELGADGSSAPGRGPYRSVAGTRMQVGPAPGGEPAKVAVAVLAQNEQECGRVTAAERIPDGSIVAECENGLRYMVFDERSIGPVALNCTAAKELLDETIC